MFSFSWRKWYLSKLYIMGKGLTSRMWEKVHETKKVRVIRK